MLHCTEVSQQTVEKGQTLPRRLAGSAAAVPPRTDTPCAETPYEAADIWRAECTHSARLGSNVGLLCDGQSVIDLDTEIANRALDLGVTEQQLDGPQIADAAIDQRGLGPPQ